MPIVSFQESAIPNAQQMPLTMRAEMNVIPNTQQIPLSIRVEIRNLTPNTATK